MSEPTRDGPPRFDGWACPRPLRGHERVVLGHGGGGRLSADLVEHLFLPALGSEPLARLADAAVLDLGGARLAATTDAYVVRPLEFPGGSIGTLAVNGTVNDLAMVGARPLVLTIAFVVEEGLSLEVLARIAADVGRAASAAGVQVVAGDTKVVEHGHGDGLYVTTAGIGAVPPGVDIGPDRCRPGDVVLCSGPIGRHGVAILSVRDGLDFGTTVESDTAPLHELVAALLAAAPGVHALRDPTRGGVAATLNELARASSVGIELDDAAVPVPPAVGAACELLGLDPLHVANEGVLVAVVPADEADAALDALRSRPEGRDAVAVGRVAAEHPGLVAARTPLGATRIVDLPLGEQLPRIC